VSILGDTGIYKPTLLSIKIPTKIIILLRRSALIWLGFLTTMYLNDVSQYKTIKNL
jgi:hypothetical protein